MVALAGTHEVEVDGDEDSVDSFLREAAAISEPALVQDPRALLRSGQTLCGRFEVEEARGRGGMGAVYRAIDRQTRRRVALKVMDRLGASSQRRFVREARILSRLQHPGIVRYLDQGTTPEGVTFLVMEWLEGEDLEERLKRKGIAVSESLVLVRRIADALQLAHSRGIVHRDIKPSNLFLPASAPDAVKLLDFGIARSVDDSLAITRSGDFLGTIGYVAPEQAMGDARADARSDIFALGCVLYRCLTQRAPFESPHPVAVLAKVLREDPPPPSEVRPELGVRFDTFVARLLAKRPDERVPSISAFLCELDELEGRASGEVGSGRRRTAVGLLRAEQRIVSVVLADASGPTAPEGAARDPVRAMLADHAELRLLARSYSAEIAPLRGGALLMVLGGRGEAHDRAARAARCALELRQLRPDLSVAIATGLAETSGQIPVGVAIDRAAAVLRSGPSGAPGVHIDALTYGLVESRFELQVEGERRSLLGERRDHDTTRSLMGKRTPFVGRDKELRLLQATLEEASAERVARVVLVTGPPGIGKSRLSNEWLAPLVSLPAVRVLVAKAEPMTQASASSLVRPLLRSAVGARNADCPLDEYSRLRQYVERIAPGPAASQTAEFLGEVLGISSEEPSAFLRAARKDPEIMREQIRRALQVWIDAETALNPVVVILEDLHWSDPASVSFLVEAARRSAERPFMVLALARPDIERTFPEVCRLATLHLRLSGLTPGAAKQLVQATLTPAPSEARVSRLLQTADGNAFYLEELIRSVAAGATQWPDTVLAMAQARLEQLEPAARRALRAASVFGQTCWDEGVAHLMDSSMQHPCLLESLADREILLRVRPSRYAGVSEYRFRHALLRDAAYAMLTDADREQAHRAAAAWLEAKGERDAR
jgi:eukaryotic-like serine/threonine-protein kinase